MKNPTIIIFVLLLTACSGGKADYGKTITGHLLSKAPSGKGYEVEILELEKLSAVTVADSVAILRAEFEKDRDAKIEHARGVIDIAAMLPDGNEVKQSRIALQQHAIDSLTNLPVPVYYDDFPPDKVLAVIVRCRYSVSAENSNSPVTETFDFWLSPDGSRVEHQKRAK